MSVKNFFSLPNLLSLARLVLSPLILPLLIVYFLPLNYHWLNGLLALLFALFSITDFFDGYLARRYEQVTTIGKLLDLIADKFLVYSVLIALLAIHKIYFVWVLIIIGREFFMFGLRQLSLEYHISVHVSWWGKLKTVFQMIYLTFLIYNPYHTLAFDGFVGLVGDFYAAPGWTSVEILLTVLAVGLSIISAYKYYKAFMVHYLQHPG
jgi:CDP-diacylglycerol---glycerol-3-phosphate 3-phosphatidyltransferase